MLAQYIPKVRRAALVMALAAMLALVSIIGFTTDGRSSHVQAPSAMLAVTSEDVVSPLAATSSSVVTITDATIAIASKTVTDNGILTTSSLLLLAVIGAIYLKDIFRPTRTPTNTPTMVSSVTFRRFHGGGRAYAASIAVLALVLAGLLVQTTGISSA